MTADPVRQWACARPDARALVTGARAWSWADLDARVSACAAQIAGPAEPLAVRADTSPELVVLVLAALRAERLLVPISTRWPNAAVAAALARLGIGRLLCDTAVEGIEVAPLTDVLGRTASGSAEQVETVETVTPAAVGAAEAASGISGHRAPGAGHRAPNTDTPWTVVHTSGSTGTPKPILHTVGNHVASARGVIEHLDLREGDRWLLDLPLYHVGGLGIVVRCVLAGATLAVPPRSMPPAERVARLRPTHASFVATQLLRLLDADADLSSLRAVLLGGSAIPPGLVERARQRGVPVSVSYGLTEMASTVTATDLGEDASTSGRPLAGRDVRISAEGEVEVGGPALAGRMGAGETVPLGPWYPTGDLGMVDEQGRLTITGRRDLQFVSGGENVRPEAIEAALQALPMVAEAVVVPVPDSHFGHRPVAFIRSASGTALDPGALADALRLSLPGFMVPVAFHDWRGTEGMKPDRPALTREAERRAAPIYGREGEGGSPQSPVPSP